MLRNLLIISCLAFGLTAQAQGEIDTLKVSGKNHYKGQNMVRLHALANQQLSAMGETPSDFELVGVTMEAKSKAGQGQATLVVGQDKSTQRIGRVSGNKLVWQATAPWTYKTVEWDLRGAEGQAQERWRLRLNGNIKVRSIHLHLASATTRVRIPMGGELMTQSSVIRLKQLLRQQGYDVRRAKLKRVVLVAKSRAGKGNAALHIGQNVKPAKIIGRAKNGLGFQSERPRSYNRIRWNAAGQTRGKWQIHMRGRIKVKAVIVEFR